MSTVPDPVPTVSDEFYRQQEGEGPEHTLEEWARELERRLTKGYHGLVVINEYQTVALIRALRRAKP